MERGIEGTRQFADSDRIRLVILNLIIVSGKPEISNYCQNNNSQNEPNRSFHQKNLNKFNDLYPLQDLAIS
jgi:hypothetical protein